MTLRDLVKPLQGHPFFDAHPMSPGEILSELKRCAVKTQASTGELLYAIQVMCRNPKRYPDPFYTLKEDWQFMSGQCVIQDHRRKEQAEVSGYHDSEAVRQALRWYRGLSGQDQHSLLARIEARMKQIFCNQAEKAYLWADPLSSLLGKQLLAWWHRYYTDVPYRERHHAYYQHL
jgi:hypothetical protein